MFAKGNFVQLTKCTVIHQRHKLLETKSSLPHELNELTKEYKSQNQITKPNLNLGLMMVSHITFLSV